MYETVRDFARQLEQVGELVRVSAPVSPILEIAELADRESKSPAARLPSQSARRSDPRFHGLGGRALLLENVAGSDIPVLINGWGSYSRMEMALGCPEGGFDEIAGRIAELVKPEPPRSIREVWTKLRQFLPLLRIPPKRRRGLGLCQEVVRTGEDVDLTRLPIIRCWPHDGHFAALGYPAGVNHGIPGLGSGAAWERDSRGRYITLGGIHTIHADDLGNPKPSSHNIGMYRVQLLGPRTMAMHWHMHHDGARHWRSWKQRGEPMPVAIALGGESVMPYAATAPLPPGISELLLAGFLHRRGIAMVMGRTVPVWVPANAEIVIEGYVSHEAGGIGWDPRDPGAGPLGPGAVFEGPFGDHTGFYSMPDRYPILTVTAVTHRRDPIYPTTVVGLPPQEDYFLGKATERIFLPLLRTIVHDIEDYDLPLFGAFHNCAFVKVRKAYPFQARRVMHSVWGAGQMAWTKCVFVVDHDVDVHDHEAVLRAAAERCEPVRDVESVNGPLDILDHAAPVVGAGMKFGFDCTRRMPGEERHGRIFDAPVTSEPFRRLPTSEESASIVEICRRAPGVLDASNPGSCAHGWLFLRIDKHSPGQGLASAESAVRAIAAAGLPVPPRVIAVDAQANVGSLDESMFHWLAHTDVSRDSSALQTPGGLVEVYDATAKVAGDDRHGVPVRAWPPMLAMPDAVRTRMAERRHELGLA
jgi:4-hydroxy-3-polyprenylbenzoate decarboxylase